MVTKGYKTGGRKPLSEAGPGKVMTIRVAREVYAGLAQMAVERERPLPELTRSILAAEVKRWAARRVKRAGRKPARTGAG